MSERLLTFAACSVGYWAPQGPTFHWRDGWMFARGEAGDVHIWHQPEPRKSHDALVTHEDHNI